MEENNRELFLDLDAPVNKAALAHLNWERIQYFADLKLPIVGVFQKAICNRYDCPIKWKDCRGDDHAVCHFYALLRSAWKKGGVAGDSNRWSVGLFDEEGEP